MVNVVNKMFQEYIKLFVCYPSTVVRFFLGIINIGSILNPVTEIAATTVTFLPHSPEVTESILRFPSAATFLACFMTVKTPVSSNFQIDEVVNL